MKVCSSNHQIQQVPGATRAKSQEIETKFSISTPFVAGKLNKLALLALGLYALSSLPVAEGGPMAYAVCVETCFLLAGPFVPVCVFGCLPFLTAPTP